MAQLLALAEEKPTMVLSDQPSAWGQRASGFDATGRSLP